MTEFTFKDKFKLAVELKNLTSKELAKFFKVDNLTIDQWKYRGPPKKRKSSIASYFGVEDWVFSDGYPYLEDFKKILNDPSLQDKLRLHSIETPLELEDSETLSALRATGNNENKNIKLIFILITIFIIVGTIYLFLQYIKYNDSQQKTQLLKTDKIPQLIINTMRTNNEETTLIKNEGYPLNELRVITAVFIEFEFGEIESLLIRNLIPLNGYYSSGFPSGKQKGLLYEVKDFQNYSKYLKLSDDIQEYFKKRKFNAFDKLRRFIKIEYKDIFNENHVEYYEVSLMGATKLDILKGESYFKLHRDASKNNNVIELNNVDLDYLFKECNKNTWAEQ